MRVEFESKQIRLERRDKIEANEVKGRRKMG